MGVTIDNKLNGSIHINNLKRECAQRQNILKTLGHYKWGAQKEILLNIYRAIIQSKLDNGCVCYGTASPKILRKLDVIHNTALRISSGAFRTSPTDSLNCETGLMPLNYRRTKLTMCYIANLAKDSSILTYQHFYSNTLNHLHHLTYTPQQKLLAHRLTTWNISLPCINHRTFNQTTPWTLSLPKQNLQLSAQQARCINSCSKK